MNPIEFSTADVMMFARESFKIEGLEHDLTVRQIEAHAMFFELDKVTLEDLSNLVNILQPGVTLRLLPGQDVMIGGHRPPRGGPAIRTELTCLLANINANTRSPYEMHKAYENLHPFMDGNGRSGRALWAWQMIWYKDYQLQRGFLHQWYYQSLAESR